MKIKFLIITTTYNRSVELDKVINSLLIQKYTNWQMIIVNDSPMSNYTEIENKINQINTQTIKQTNTIDNSKIIYIKNLHNIGKNKSCNIALSQISKDIDYIIFLDDDDWMASDTLEQINIFLEHNNYPKWLVTNRYDTKNNISLTRNLKNTNNINYLLDYLILKKFRGDATHIISTKIKNFNNTKFSSIKNAEEWIYFAQLQDSFVYFNHNSTLTLSYQYSGITSLYKNKIQKLKNTYTLFVECKKYNIVNNNIMNKKNYLIILYFILRICAIIIKK